LPAALPPDVVPTGCAADNIGNNSLGCTSLGNGVPFSATTLAPYQEQWNLNVQRDLGRGTILSVGYVGSRGVHLFVQKNLNPSLTSTAVTLGCSAGQSAAGCPPAPGPPAPLYARPVALASGSPCVPTVGNLAGCFFGTYSPFSGGVIPLLPRANNNYGPLNENV